MDAPWGALDWYTVSKTSYFTAASETEFEKVVKGSRFIGFVTSIQSVEAALAKIAQVHRLLDAWRGLRKGEANYTVQGLHLTVTLFSEDEPRLGDELREITREQPLSEVVPQDILILHGDATLIDGFFGGAFVFGGGAPIWDRHVVRASR